MSFNGSDPLWRFDPHTRTHDIIIEITPCIIIMEVGISLNCYNILIEKNKVHDNAEDGIDQ
jgi:hypothetical protein